MSATTGDGDRRERARTLFARRVADLREALDRMGPEHAGAVFALAEAVGDAWDRGGKLLLCGNGGSAADAQHIAAELVGRFGRERPAWPALALTVNTSVLTAVANDYGYDEVFARQVAGLGGPDDVLLVISTSGDSPNCLRAVAVARERGLKVFGFLGGDGGRLAPLVDASFTAPAASTPRVQELHIAMGHLLCELLEERRTGDGAGEGDDA